MRLDPFAPILLSFVTFASALVPRPLSSDVVPNSACKNPRVTQEVFHGEVKVEYVKCDGDPVGDSAGHVTSIANPLRRQEDLPNYCGAHCASPLKHLPADLPLTEPVGTTTCFQDGPNPGDGGPNDDDCRVIYSVHLWYGYWYGNQRTVYPYGVRQCLHFRYLH